MSTNRVRPTPHAIDLGAVKISVSDYASQGNAILGIRDSGKSYTATAVAEQLMTAGIPIVAFDPIGVWRNLRHAGTGQGFEIILIGDDGEAPISPDTAEGLIRHAMKTKASIIFDLYSMKLSKADWRRVVERCVRVLLYENKSHGPRHVFLEEAAEFVPQMLTREYFDVYAEIEKLVRMGGNAMVGITLINQRAEQVNKAVLELCACLILHAQKGRLSLTALGKWLDFGDKKQSGLIIRQMPLLEQGECFVWAGGTDSPVRTKVPPKQTFHPNRRAHTTPGRLMPAAHLMKGYEAAQPAKAAKSKIEWVEPTKAAEPERVEVPVFAEGDLAKLDLLRTEMMEAVRTLARTTADMDVLLKKTDEAVKRASRVSEQRTLPTATRTAPSPYTGGKKTIEGKGPQKILAVLASRHPLRVTQAQLGTICGFRPGTMRTYMPGLRGGGLIDENKDGLCLTPEGLAQVGTEIAAMPTRGEPLLTFWCSKMGQGEANVLKALYDCGGKAITHDQLESMTHYSAGTLRTYLPVLRRNNLIEPKELRIMPEFLD
jgi:hypothetical protein